VVYGYLHIPRTTWHDGVRFKEVSLGYPDEWQQNGAISGMTRRGLLTPWPPLSREGARMNILIADVIGDVALVLLAASLLGALARRCGQPAVVGQIFTGVFLGPSVLGRLPGHLTSRLFPHAVLPSLTVLSNIAVVIFMFVVGYELDRRSLHGRFRAVPLIAAGALLVPMGLGAGATVLFRSSFAALGEPHLSHSFVLFMAVAVSITALPVLAAITRERGIAGTMAGITATSAAGIMDVAAWVVLAAALVGTTQKSGLSWPVTLVLIIGFAAIMLLAVRPALRWWFSRRRSVLSNHLPIALVLALGSAWVTASLGLHPVFGGFLAGLTMPGTDGTPDTEVLRPMEQIGGVLLPLFFIVTGLSMNIGALGSTGLVLLVIVCVIASVGKLGPAYLASRVGGLGPRDSAAIAALVNTRGLTELIALDVGLSAGLIDQRLFSVLVLMALIMTVMTSPLLSLIRVPTASPPVGERHPVAPPPSGASEH
jgi:Kef-type K+ transport system membrane component KefB